ncbi:mitochondrial potassium channel ATP-binding subunit-like [Saccoglossus kowalevskii]|uniref:Mitochondrial potassium channel ATP-binding subunit n=1 Tax=Saccoglossus kowalevskii TaxID=10224 RepID=A0ABM0M291_SACKO|nr:PREDICTED: ATP-binding cassette sub-family B member 8, mitochondrial-like [Saccoglossus kowalevskii]
MSISAFGRAISVRKFSGSCLSKYYNVQTENFQLRRRGQSFISNTSRKISSNQLHPERLRDILAPKIKQYLLSNSKNSPWGLKLTFGLSSLGAVCICKQKTAQCKIRTTGRVIQKSNGVEKQPTFRWKDFWEYLSPEMLHLLAAILSAFAVAIVNIKMPLLIGDLVEVVSKFTSENAGNYLQEMKKPALRLIALYGIQGILTFGYISLLSSIGERIANRMRKALFQSLIQQDIAFFDANKTGELVSRLTADVQDFKSSFKLCISQGLRSTTQVLGCMLSIYVLSPKLTALMIVVIPSMVLGGTAIGHVLHRPAKEATKMALVALLIPIVLETNKQTTYDPSNTCVVLQNFNLELKNGQMVALCGLSGGGKSTIASLLERFYEVEGGCVMIDGHDIRSLDPSWLRGRVIGFINQEPVLFATTVKENIRYGRPEATDKEVYEAATQANADSFIKEFPDGYDTVLGERGVTVSGGQKQRIAIARALIKNPSILILDEATSALDAESERVVQEALERVIKGRTVLVIAHRLSTVQNADVIAVIANGKIVEIGTHTELKAKKKGVYRDLIQRQSTIDTGTF